MDSGTVKSSDLLRLVGIMAIGVGVAWALQTIGFGGDAFSRTLWVVSSAAIAGAGVGLLVAASHLPTESEGLLA